MFTYVKKIYALHCIYDALLYLKGDTSRLQAIIRGAIFIEINS